MPQYKTRKPTFETKKKKKCKCLINGHAKCSFAWYEHYVAESNKIRLDKIYSIYSLHEWNENDYYLKIIKKENCWNDIVQKLKKKLKQACNIERRNKCITIYSLVELNNALLVIKCVVITTR